jgi:uncharacterized protein (UPF0276 family)
MPYTFEAAQITARKIREARDFLEVPIAVENVSSYAEFHISEMNEWEFLNEGVERADGGILLDVNNIYVSSQNHDFKVVLQNVEHRHPVRPRALHDDVGDAFPVEPFAHSLQRGNRRVKT